MGDTVVTTLDADLQEAAYQALGEKKGAVVVMEPKTGKILAMVSKPDFDPNTILILIIVPVRSRIVELRFTAITDMSTGRSVWRKVWHIRATHLFRI